MRAPATSSVGQGGRRRWPARQWGDRTQAKAGRADWPTAENQLELAEAFSLQSEK